MTKEKKLDEYLRRFFPRYFAETNLHWNPVDIDYGNKNGIVTASVTLSLQEKPDFKECQQRALFTYKSTIEGTTRNYYWHCTIGLPGD